MKAKEMLKILEDLWNEHRWAAHREDPVECDLCKQAEKAVRVVRDSIPYYMAPGDME